MSRERLVDYKQPEKVIAVEQKTEEGRGFFDKVEEYLSPITLKEVEEFFDSLSQLKTRWTPKGKQ